MNLQSTEGGQASFVNNLAQWHAALQELYKTAPSHGQTALSYALPIGHPGLWPSQPLLGGYPPAIYNQLFGNTVAVPSTPTSTGPAATPTTAEKSAAAPTSSAISPKIDASPNVAEPPSKEDARHASQPEPTKEPASSHEGKSLNNASSSAPLSTSPQDYLQPSSAWLSDGNAGRGSGQEDKEGKKMKRKQSNRESARRSRLRKQAETEQLSKTVKDLLTENQQLKDSVEQLKTFVDKLLQHKQGLISQVKELGGAVHHEFEHGLLVCKVEDFPVPATQNENDVAPQPAPQPEAGGDTPACEKP